MHPELLDGATPAWDVSGASVMTRRETDAYRKVSQAAMSTRNPFWMSQKQTLDRFVLFPTPLTPTKVMLYGRRCCEVATGVDNLVRIDSRRSVDVFGVSIRVMELASACRTADVVAERHPVTTERGDEVANVTHFGSLQLSCQRDFDLRLRRSCRKSPLRRFSS